MSVILSKPITFSPSGKTAANLLLKSAMTERLCAWSERDLDERGKPTPEYIRVYEEWGKGQMGILVLGNIPVDRRYPVAERDAIIDPLAPWDPVEAFKPTIAAAKAHGALVLGQIVHAGRQTPTAIAQTPVSPSDVQSPPLGGLTFGKPRPLTLEEVEDVVARFAYAAKVLYDAGADGVQLHAAHGYLLSQFLSPRVNTRTDAYGGAALENRARIVFDIIAAIRAAVPDPRFMLAIKMNSHDFIEGGFDADDARTMARALDAAGVDLIELSGGTYEDLRLYHKQESTRRREAFFIEFAERIRPHLSSAKLCLTGGFRTVAGMERALTDGATDLIGLGRPLAAEPRLCGALLSGVRVAAKPNLVDDQVSAFAGIMQVQNVGRGEPILDFADGEVAHYVEELVRGSRSST